MSTTTTTVLDPTAYRVEHDPTRAWRDTATLVLGAAASLLMVASNLAMPVLNGSNANVVAHIPPVADRLLATHLLWALASMLFIPFTLALWRIDTRRGAVLRLGGGSLLIVGMVCNAVSEVTEGYLAWGAHQVSVDPSVQVRLFDLLDNSSAALPISWLDIPVAAVGALLLAIGVLRSRSMPTWAPVLLIIGVLTTGALRSGPIALLGLVLSAGSIAVLYYVPRTTYARA